MGDYANKEFERQLQNVMQCPECSNELWVRGPMHQPETYCPKCNDPFPPPVCAEHNIPMQRRSGRSASSWFCERCHPVAAEKLEKGDNVYFGDDGKLHKSEVKTEYVVTEAPSVSEDSEDAQQKRAFVRCPTCHKMGEHDHREDGHYYCSTCKWAFVSPSGGQRRATWKCQRCGFDGNRTADRCHACGLSGPSTTPEGVQQDRRFDHMPKCPVCAESGHPDRVMNRQLDVWRCLWCEHEMPVESTGLAVAMDSPVDLSWMCDQCKLYVSKKLGDEARRLERLLGFCSTEEHEDRRDKCCQCGEEIVELVRVVAGSVQWHPECWLGGIGWFGR